jgi:dihydrofolate synthase/folylpolyglutamate synthase
VQLWNAAASLMTVHLLSQRLPVEHSAIETGLEAVRLSGRFQRIKHKHSPGVEWVLDVAHNPMSATVLATHLRQHALVNHLQGRTIAVFGMLSDKDVVGTVNALHSVVDEWIASGLNAIRALPEQQLAIVLRSCGVTVHALAADVASACCVALEHSRPGDRILVCGSFLTVGAALTWLEQ